VLALGLDATAREYDLNAVALGGWTQEGHGTTQQMTLLRIESVGAICYLYFSDVHDGSPDLDDATVISAGGSLTFDTAMCARIASGATADFWIDRSRDRYLTVKGSGAGTLRIYAASEASA
jgi:hypothetical protein